MVEAPSRPVRVLHLISTLDIGGAEQNLFRLLGSMNGEAFENSVVCMRRPGPMAEKITALGVPVFTLGMRPGVPDATGALRLRAMANRLMPEVIQCWMYHANLLGLALLAPLRTLWNIRCSDMDLSHYSPLYRLTVRAGALFSRVPLAAVTNSESGRAAHERMGYRPKRWITIHNGFDIETFKPDPDAGARLRAELGIPEGALVIGHVGRFDPMKDHATFFRAAYLFLKERPEAHFVLAGRGVTSDNGALVSLMPDASQMRNFHLLGERDDIPRILPGLDIAVSSSVSEGFPNAIGEAMACGVPCVATDAGDTGLLLGNTGTLVKKSSPGELCRAWAAIACMDPTDRIVMGMMARERIKLHYSQEKTTASYEQEYLKIVKS